MSEFDLKSIIERYFYETADEIQGKTEILLGLRFERRQTWMLEVLERVFSLNPNEDIQSLKNLHIWIGKLLWTAEEHKNTKKTRDIIGRQWKSTIDLYLRRNDLSIREVKQEFDSKAIEQEALAKKAHEERENQRLTDIAKKRELKEHTALGELLTIDVEASNKFWEMDTEFLAEVGVSPEVFGVTDDE